MEDKSYIEVMHENYIEAFKKYVDVTGRSRRREFWLFYLVNTIILGILYFWLMVVMAIGTTIEGDDATALGIMAGLISLVVFLYYLAVLLPSICV
jgi:uncharacterized membrane protein YhaH (DUF805 family)